MIGKSIFTAEGIGPSDTSSEASFARPMPEALQNIPWLASAGLEAGCRQEVLRRPLACARLEGRAVGTPAGRALDAMVARPATTLQPQ